jgi:hypothetical protein
MGKLQLVTEAQDRALKRLRDHAPPGTWIPGSVVIQILSISPRVIGELTSLRLLERQAKRYRLPPRGVRAISTGVTAAIGDFVEPDQCEGQHEGVRVSIRFSRPVRRADIQAAGKAVAVAFQGLVERVRGQA